MKVEDLEAACRKAIAEGRDGIVLKMTSGVRLCGTKGPVGELLCDAGRGTVVRFEAKRVLEYLLKQR